MLGSATAISFALLTAAAASAQDDQGVGGPEIPLPEAGVYAQAAAAPETAVPPGAAEPQGVTLDEALHCYGVGAALAAQAERGEASPAAGEFFMTGFESQVDRARESSSAGDQRLAATLASVSGYTLAELEAEMPPCAEAMGEVAPALTASEAS